MARSILVIHPGALGDVLLAVPAMRWLRKRMPDHHIHLISNEAVGLLLREIRIIDEWMSVQGAIIAELFSGAVPDSTELRRWLGDCHLAVIWMAEEAQGLTVALSSCGIDEIRMQSPFSPHLKSRHQSDRFLETLGGTMADLPASGPLQLSPSLGEKGRATLVRMGISLDKSLAFVHPGSGSPHKCMSATALANVIVALNQDGLCSVVIEGPADEAIVSQLRSLVPMTIPVLREQDLSLVAGMMAQAQVYIGHDSGMTHLAAILGVPTLALFGPTNPEQWAPRGPNVVVLRGSVCECHSWEAVRSCAINTCLAISVDDILASVRRVIECGQKSTTPRNPSQYALSPPHPCAKVPG